MKSSSTNKGAASVLVIVAVVIVGWTIGMFIQPKPKDKKPDSNPKSEARAKDDDHTKTSQDSAQKP